MIKHVKISTWLALLIVILISSCQKEEFQRPVHGEQVPYIDSLDLSIAEILLDPEYSLFKEIWDRADMENVIKSAGNSKDQYTVFVPSNAAWTDASWTEEKIRRASPEELQRILEPHIVRTNLIHLVDVTRPGNVFVYSLSQHPTIKYTASLHPYRHIIAIDWNKERLFINGEEHGEKFPVLASDGCVWGTNKILETPQLTAWETLKRDPRFSIYTGLLERTDREYVEIFKQANGHYPDFEDDVERPYARHTPDRLGMMIRQAYSGELFVTDLNTFFIPTDDAFRKAGFASVDDLIAFNVERGYPSVTWQDSGDLNGSGFYRIVGEFATDTLLDFHHNWGFRFADAPYRREGHRNLFYSNDLRNEVVYDFPVGSLNIQYFTERGGFVRAETDYYKMPFVFENNLIKIPNTEVSSEWIEDNIVTLNGVLHGVKNLLLPEGF